MVQRKSTRRRRFSAGVVTEAVIFVLCHGHWFFGPADFDWSDWPADRLREAWLDLAVRERVYARYHGRRYPGVPFAQVAFGPEGKGGKVKIDADIPAARAEYRRPWEAAAGGGNVLVLA